MYLTNFFKISFIIFVVNQAQSLILFPESFVLQLTICIAVPSTIPNRTFALNMCMQANYMAISNVSQLSPTLITAKKDNSNSDIDRKTLYGYIISILNEYIFAGEECLKRLICESAASTIDTTHKNSLLEKILLFIVTPSNDIFNQNDTEMMLYHEAEHKGRLKRNCVKEYNNCQFSILDFFTTKL